MLAALERRLTAVVADAVADRTHIAVVQAAGLPSVPAAGNGTLRVRLRSVAPAPAFARAALAVERTGAGPRARRVLPLGFTLGLEYAVRAASASAADVSSARNLLLEDVSRVAFALTADQPRAGATLEGAASGFAVGRIELTGAELPTADSADVVSASLEFDGGATVWPPEVAPSGGTIRAVDTVQVALPLSFAVAQPIVSSGSSTAVRIGGAHGRRLVAVDPPAREPLQLAVTVLSDLPPADRGRIVSGSAGAATGLRIVLAEPETEIVYAAPPLDLGGVKREYVAVHLATGEGGAGAFLGSTPIELAEA